MNRRLPGPGRGIDRALCRERFGRYSYDWADPVFDGSVMTEHR